MDYRLEDIEQIIDARLISNVRYERLSDDEDVALQIEDSTYEKIYSIVYPRRNEPLIVILQYRLVDVPVPRRRLTQEIWELLVRRTNEFGLSLAPLDVDNNQSDLDLTATIWFRYSRQRDEYRRNLETPLRQVREFHIKYGDDLKKMFGDL